MISLLSIITPEFGLFFWTAVIFLLFFFLLRRFAWTPIINALHARENSIEEALSQAQKAREDMAQLSADNEVLLKEARIERDKILREANELKDRIISDAKKAAAEEATKATEKAMQQLQAEKRAAMEEVRTTAATIAVEVAEKILRKEFENKGLQESFANTLIGEMNQN